MKTVISIIVTLNLWASAFVAIRAALHDYSPLHLAVTRFVIASCTLLGCAAFKRIRWPETGDLALIAVTGFIGITLYNAALNYAELTIPAAIASFIVNTVPVLTAFLATCFLNESMGVRGWVGALISFSGVSLIAIGETGKFTFNRGISLILAAAVCQSFFFVLQKPLLRKYPPFDTTCYLIWAGTLFLLIFSQGLISTIKTADWSSTVAILYLGIFPAAIAYLSWSYVLKQLPVSSAVMFLYLVPGLAIVIGYLWLNEIPHFISLIGGVVAIGGVALVNSRKRLEA